MYLSAQREALEPTCKDCVRVVEGNIPIIITLPHGGSLKPDNIKNRTNGCYNETDEKCYYLHNCPGGTVRDPNKYAFSFIF